MTASDDRSRKEGCHLCGSADIEEIPGFEGLRRVTSDCRPWTAGGYLGVCRGCGGVIKFLDERWQNEVRDIYDAYSIYHQSGGVEQAVFEDEGGAGRSRSVKLLDCLQTHCRLPAKGRLLDVGCGNGALLRSFSRLEPSWTLAGSELNEKYREPVERIAGVEGMYPRPPGQIPGIFDLITAVHVLEHITTPRMFLAELRDKLVADGLLVVELPDFLHNPFDLLIADHCTHFTVETATKAIQDAGFEVLVATTEWIQKEITVVARKNEGENADCLADEWASREAVIGCLRWLEIVKKTAQELVGEAPLGLFGTSIAGTWLLGELGEGVDFFVDEDPHRTGRLYREIPVLHPRDVDDKARVFIGLPFPMAGKIGKRLAREYGFHCCLPPILDGAKGDSSKKGD